MNKGANRHSSEETSDIYKDELKNHDKIGISET